MAGAAAWFIFLCRAGSTILGITALVFAIKAYQAIPTAARHPLKLRDPHQRLMVMLAGVTVPWALLLLLVESCSLNVELHQEQEQEQQQRQQQERPWDVKIFVFLMLLEWLLTFITIGMALPALIVDLRATSVCATYQLAADVAACAAGALAAASAVGQLWVLAPRLCRARA